MAQPNKPSQEDLLLLQALLEEQAHRKKYCKLDYMFPDTGEYSRDKYKKQLAFFKAGKDHKLRMFMAGNQSGKTLAGVYECALHVTGRYPHWWEGLRLVGDVDVCIVGNNAEFTRNILQDYILGSRSDPGTGFIPKARLHGDPISKAGTAQAVSVIPVLREDGGRGNVFFKDYTQGRNAFMGDRFHFLMLDEEPADDIYTEAITRTATTKGSVILTFTPLHGYSKVVERFMVNGMIMEGEHPLEKEKYVVRASWDDVPHLDPEQKEFLISQYPAHERDARTKGIPSAGEGAVFPVATSEYVVEPFALPSHWPRAYGLDPGIKCTAAVWAAMDPESGTYYVYSEHYQGEQQVPVHANSIMHGNGIVKGEGRAPWIRGAIDPAASNRTTMDSQTTAMLYKQAGLDLVFLRQPRETGLLRINNMLASGQLKIFSSCQNLLKEMYKATRDDTGKVKDQHQYHATDALRYVLNPDINIFRTLHSYKASLKGQPKRSRRDRGASSVTGY